MPLIINKGEKPKIADKDIICYKGFGLDASDESLVSPWKGAKWNFLEDPIQKAEGDVGKISIYVEGGYIHSFKEVDNVSKVTNAPLVVECIIPKGTEYYEGKEFNDLPGYASKKIKFSKFIESALIFPISEKHIKIIQEDSLYGDLVEDTLCGKRFKRYPNSLGSEKIKAIKTILDIVFFGSIQRKNNYTSLYMFKPRCYTGNYLYCSPGDYDFKEILDAEELEKVRKTILSDLCFVGCTSIGRILKNSYGELYIDGIEGIFNEAWKSKSLSELISESYSHDPENKSLLMFEVDRFFCALEEIRYTEREHRGEEYNELLQKMKAKIEHELGVVGCRRPYRIPRHCYCY